MVSPFFAAAFGTLLFDLLFDFHRFPIKALARTFQSIETKIHAALAANSANPPSPTRLASLAAAKRRMNRAKNEVH